MASAQMAAPPQPAAPSWRLEPLAGWHLPLLHDPAFLPLQPVLQRAVWLGVPERLLHALTARQPLAPRVLVAFQGTTPEGLIVTRRVNRSGSCWQVQHLRLASSSHRRQLASCLLRAAIRETRGASSWIANAASLDSDRLAVLREQGFQPLRTDQLWRWNAMVHAAPAADPAACPADLQLQPLSRRHALPLWQLEQAACPAQLRQLLDRRVEDLLDQSQTRGWLLVEPGRDQAVAAIRWLGEHPGGGHDVELTVHPGWQQLLGAPTELLLRRLQQQLGGTAVDLWLRCDVQDQWRRSWLQRLGAEPRGERVLMARSVWRRQEHPATAALAARQLEAVLGQLQPRRQPLPTPLTPR
ncbi:MAG: hypothetical protein RLZZ468_1513 [Cyanobacteriota bacterium]